MAPNPGRRSVLGAYHSAALLTRLHVRLRWATCPFDAIEALVPRSGRILDMGCGHGLLSIHLALSSEDRTIVGVDIDDGKLGAARSAAHAAGLAERVRSEQVDPDWLPQRGSFDAVVITDMLYLLGPTHVEAVLGASMAAVRPGGSVVVKEMADHPRWKRRFSQAQEFLSVRVAGITEGLVSDLPTERAIRAPLAQLGAVPTRHDLGAGYLHPHVAFVARRPDGPVGSGPFA